jgi:predicted nucleic acid-binding Zn ribbon protein
MYSFYCVKCRAKKEVKDVEEIVTKNHRHAVRAKCPTCNTTMIRFVKSKSTSVKGKGLDNSWGSKDYQFNPIKQQADYQMQFKSPMERNGAIWNPYTNKYVNKFTFQPLDESP